MDSTIASVSTSPFIVFLTMSAIVPCTGGNADTLTPSFGRWHTPSSAVRKSYSSTPAPPSSPTRLSPAYCVVYCWMRSIFIR